MMTSLQEAITDFLSSLSDEQLAEFRGMVISPRIEGQKQWTDEVVKRYALRDASNPVVVELRSRFSDPSGVGSVIFTEGGDQSVLEADRFLRLAQAQARDAGGGAKVAC